MRIACDIETNGLLHELDRVHSLVLRDADTGDLIASCTDHPTGRAMGYRPISEGLEILSTARTLYFHNGIGFDIPALKKVYPDWSYQGDLLDTLITAQFRWAHLRDDPQEWARVRAGRMPARFVGQHSLAAWGYRLGVLKGTYGETTDWSEWTPAMQEYCERDTEVTVALVQHIRRSGGITPLALEIEHELAWYLTQQERNGWPFDEEKAQKLLARLCARREELGEALKEHFGWWYAPNGEISPKRSMRRTNPHTPGVREQYIEGARYTKLKREEFNPGSRDHIAKRLIAVYGWEPTAFTDTGKPQVSETVLQGLKYPITDTLIDYLTVSKRLGQLSEGKEAWLRHSTRDGEEGGRLTGIPHIHGRVKQNHAVTHRAAHSNPNIAQVPKVSVPFGAECRELFTVPEGWVQVGADASGLELRCLAHYMARYDGGEYSLVVTEGDVHSTNRDALGWQGAEGRERAKTWIYAYLYGAGDEKLGSVEDPTATPEEQKRIGAERRKDFERRLSAMGRLVHEVKSRARKPGYLRMPDGRRTYIRHQHAALNSLLQGAGAIICKLWIVRFQAKLTERFGPQGWRGQWAALGWIHDEVQIATRPDIAEEVGSILVETIREVGEELNWRCPLDGEAIVGTSWKDTH